MKLTIVEAIDRKKQNIKTKTIGLSEIEHTFRALRGVLDHGNPSLNAMEQRKFVQVLKYFSEALEDYQLVQRHLIN